MSERIASAVFDSREEAERALSELRSAGIKEDSISIIGRHGEQNDTSGGIDDDGDAGEKAGDGAKGPSAARSRAGCLALRRSRFPVWDRLLRRARLHRARSPAQLRSVPVLARLPAASPA